MFIWQRKAAAALSRPRSLRGLIERGIGVETMDTAAACRTYKYPGPGKAGAWHALLLRPAGNLRRGAFG